MAQYIVNYSDGSRTITVRDEEVFGPSTFPITSSKFCNPRPITSANISSKAFVIEGNFTYRFVAGFEFQVSDSDSNDAVYTVDSRTYSSINDETTIIVNEAFFSQTGALGNIFYVVPTSSIETTLTLVGRKFYNYGDYINENFLHLLENFANDAEPPYPTLGQLWYDTGSSTLKVYNDTAFVPITGETGITQTFADGRYVKKAGDTMTGLLILSGAPSSNLHAATKLYVDTAVQNKYIAAFAQDTFVGNEVIMQGVIPITLKLLAGAGTSRFKAATNSTSDLTFLIKKNGTQVGTIDVANDTVSGTFTVASDVTFSPGDLIKIVAPAVADAAYTDISITINLVVP